tara:strand:+ start:344 stop:910 length:567 start_codon:yes stop_codon:yes gene_type:complete
MEIDDFIRTYKTIEKKPLSKFLAYVEKTKAFKEAPVITKKGLQVNTNIRDVKTLFLNDLEKSLTNVHWYNYFNNCFLKCLEEYRQETNSEFLHHKNNFEMNVLKYDRNNFYTWHTDHGFSTPRTISCILFCNDDYEGGNLAFKLPNNEEFSVEGKPGELIMWPSNFMYPHCVKPVTSGNRITVVGWVV